MAAGKDKQDGMPTGFSGLSTLVSDVDDGLPAGKPTLAVPPAETLPMRSMEAPPAPAEPRAPNGKSDSSSDATTGKWMVGIGLGIGLLLILILNAMNSEPSRSTAAPAAQPPPTTAPPSDAARQQSAHEAISPRSATTESVNVLGQQLVFSNPSGYCTPGKSAREVELLDLAQRALGEGARLVHAAVSCSELDDYRNGRREMWDHWLQIQLIGPKGDFRRIEIQREAFLSAVADSIPRVSAAEVRRRIEASLDRVDMDLTEMKIEPIGRDGNAVYSSMRMNIAVGDISRPISGISAITLLNSLPLSVTVYEGTGSRQSRGELRTVLQELLNSLLTEN